MGFSQVEKQESHERIVKIAAERFRERGVDGIGVADIMKEAGLTHGGFYRHFASRDALVAEAVDYAAQAGADLVGDILARNPKSPLVAYIDYYLSTKHRDSPGHGCVMTALAADVARSDKETRTGFTRRVRNALQRLAELFGEPNRKNAQREAMVALSTMVGALALSRAVNDEALSLEFLKSANETIKAQARR